MRRNAMAEKRSKEPDIWEYGQGRRNKGAVRWKYVEKKRETGIIQIEECATRLQKLRNLTNNLTALSPSGFVIVRSAERDRI